MSCVLGPVTTERSAKFADNDFPDDATQKFTTGNILNMDAKDIQGLITPGKRDNYNEKTTLGMSNRGWGIIYVDTSTGVTGQGYRRRGWGILRAADENLISNVKANLKCTIDMLSYDPFEPLTMDYTVDRVFSSDYNHQVQNFKLNEPFTTFNIDPTTGNWYDAVKYSLNTGSSSISAVSDELTFTAVASVLNKQGFMSTQTIKKFTAPMSIEFDLKKVTTPAAGRPGEYLLFFLSPNRQTGNIVWKDMIYIMMYVTSTAIQFAIRSIDKNGKVTTHINNTTTVATTHKWKLDMGIVGNKGYLTASLDIGDGNGYIQKYYGPTAISTFGSLYAGYIFECADTIAQTMKSSFLQIYTWKDREYNNIVGLPVGCTVLNASSLPTPFNRLSKDGNIICYPNPPGNLQFICDPSHFYDGSVKAYSTLYDPAGKQIINVNEELNPTKFNCHNGLIRLETTVNSIKFYYWDKAIAHDWVLMNELGIGTIKSMKLLQINDNILKLRINSPNELIATLRRAKKTMDIEHPNTTITYTLKNRYECDGHTSSNPITTPAANTDIPLQLQDYANVYNNGDRFRMQINQLNKATVKSDSILPSVFTGIGWYDSTEATESYDTDVNIANEWRNQTLQRVILPKN